MPIIITIDQLLFWMASEIGNAVRDDSPIRNEVLLLGSFNAFTNLFGSNWNFDGWQWTYTDTGYGLR